MHHEVKCVKIRQKFQCKLHIRILSATSGNVTVDHISLMLTYASSYFEKLRNHSVLLY